MNKFPVINIAAQTAPVEHADHADHCGPCCAGTPDPEPANASPVDLAAAPGRSLRIPAMDCSVEESEIRRALDGMTAIQSLRFQLRQRVLTIDAPDEVVQQAVDVIQRAGFEVQPIDNRSPGATKPGEQHTHQQPPASPQGLASLPAVLLLGMALAVGAEVVGWVAPATWPFKLLGLALAVSAIGCAGLDVYTKGLNALRRGRLNISALMTVAVTGALLIGQWPEAAMVMVLYAVAELIEARAVDRARHAIEGLMALAPEAASVKQADGSWRDEPVATVALGAVVRVRPGERIPMDGQISSGQSSVNQAPVTGESLPVDKALGDPVYAGTINQSGSFELRVTAAASQSTLARIIQAVEQAQGSRAPMQRFVDRFAAIYTPAVFAIAVAVAVAGPWLFGWTALVAVYKALVLLVIACPCALVISTPVTLVSGLACAARRGMLIKGGVHLEQARKLKVVAFDKTGTLTEGRPQLVAWELLGDAGDDHRQRVAALAAALAGLSDHPVSLAIAQGLPAAALPVTGFAALPGRGVQGTIEGVLHRLGNHRLMEDLRLCDARVEAALQVHEAQGRTLALLADDKRVLAVFAVADAVKATSREAVAALKAMGLVPVMLTGDNQTTASAMARQCGIADARGNLLPDDKLAAVRALQSQYGPVAMVGDGINDAPALALADLGMAMGGAGTDIAMEAADVVIMNDDLRRVAEVVHLSRRTHAVLWQNIALALGIKGVFLLLALFGSASMWMAVFADMGASLLVVANGLRLLRSAPAAPE